VHGQYATLNFTGQPVYTGTGAPIGGPGNGGWANAIAEDVIFTTSSACTWSAIFGSGCGRLVFLDCISNNMVCRMTNPTSGDLYVSRHQFTQSGTPPSTINQAFSIPGSLQTTITSCTTNSTITVTTTDTTDGATIAVGQAIFGPGIQVGTTITAISGPVTGVYTLTLSLPATASATVSLYVWTIQPGYHCVLEDALVEFQQVNGAGSILSAVATAPGVGSSVEVRGGSAFASGLYLMDGVIDIEPVGWQPFAKVSVHDFDVTNSSLYLTGADFIDAGKGCKFKYNSVNANHKCLPFNGYNNNVAVNSNGPATGVVDLHDYQVYEDAVTSTGTPFIVDYEVATTSLRVHDWDVTLNPMTTFASLNSKGVFYTSAATTRFVVESGRISGGINATKSGCVVTNGSNQVTFASPLPTPSTGVAVPANVSVGWTVTGTNIPANTTITAISLTGSTYTITLSSNATPSGGTETLTFISPYAAANLIATGANPTALEVHGVQMGCTFAHVASLNAGSGTVAVLDISGNDLTQAGSRSIFASGVTLTKFTWKENKGSNPTGSTAIGTAFSLPASAGTWTNLSGTDVTLYASSVGITTALSVNGVSLPIAAFTVGSAITVPANGTLTPTYSSAPTLTPVYS
jgi:hypothetical protein